MRAGMEADRRLRHTDRSTITTKTIIKEGRRLLRW